MDDTFLFLILFGVAILGGLLWLAWWIFVVWAVVRVAKGLDGQFNQIQTELTRFRSLPPAQRQAGQQQIAAMMLQAQSQMRQLDDLRRQQYEVRMGELQGMAASAGIDWSPN